MNPSLFPTLPLIPPPTLSSPPPHCEFERLLHEYRQNQLLISNIDHFYQIIYPVQLKNHEKMGISTREVASKYPNRGSHDNYQSSLGTKGRSRAPLPCTFWLHSPVPPGSTPLYLQAPLPCTFWLHSPVPPGSTPLYLQAPLPCTFRLHSPVPSGSTPLYLQAPLPCTFRLHSPVPSDSTPLYLQAPLPCTFRLHSPVPPGSTPLYLQAPLPCTSRLHSPVPPGSTPLYLQAMGKQTPQFI
ncbi:hypothetical protein M8J75_009236 [Diaphorina citri]|nr:hypothetical protein M8J75_009236 [Diaphorina citri]